MEDILTNLLDLIEVLPNVEAFKGMTDKEIRQLALELIKIEEIRRSGNGVSNAISHIDLNI